MIIDCGVGCGSILGYGSYAGILLHDVTQIAYYILYYIISKTKELQNYKFPRLKFVLQVCLLGNLVPQQPVNGVLGVSLL